MKTGKRIVRNVFGGGRWFPDDGTVLRQMVEQYINGEPSHSDSGRFVAGIAPHAGYSFSGPVAGHTFRALRDDADKVDGSETIVVIGFSHGGGFSGTVLMDGDVIATPIGESRLDKEFATLLEGCSSSIRFDYRPHAGEHSAENEIPFIQVAVPNARLVVALMGDHDERSVDDLVAALEECAAGKSIKVIASSDMFHHSDYDLVNKTDQKTLEKISKMDVNGLWSEWSYSNQILCGISPVSAAMKWAQTQGAREGSVLKYRNSGDDYPESRGSWVVGYGAVAFYT